uniref:Uncharacterized protein n=1 Tax=Anguilla anguilla TaxID=7936 RepID=A0A0E9RKG0_ANGAN
MKLLLRTLLNFPSADISLPARLSVRLSVCQLIDWLVFFGCWLALDFGLHLSNSLVQKVGA